LDLVLQVENIAVIEGHVMPVTTEYYQVTLKDDASVTIPGSWPLALHMEDLGVLIPADRRRGAIHHAHAAAHSLTLAHLIVVCVEAAHIVVLDQERAL